MEEGNLTNDNATVTFRQAATVDGNPWVLYSEERFQTFLAYLEEGRYEDLSSIGLPADYKEQI